MLADDPPRRLSATGIQLLKNIKAERVHRRQRHFHHARVLPVASKSGGLWIVSLAGARIQPAKATNR